MPRKRAYKQRSDQIKVGTYCSIREIQDTIAEIKEKFTNVTDLTLEVESEYAYGDCNCYMNLSFVRQETDEEYDKRKAQEKAHRDRAKNLKAEMERVEREQLADLIAKYGNPADDNWQPK